MKRTLYLPSRSCSTLEKISIKRGDCMGRKRINKVDILQLKNLAAKHANFVIEYVKDFSPRRAAEASGFDPDSGYAILKEESVQEAINMILLDRLETSHITAEWLLMEAVDNHQIARQKGNIPASNAALNLIAKHVFVDAFAAEKVEVHSDKDIMERLLRGRQRAREKKAESNPVSFL